MKQDKVLESAYLFIYLIYVALFYRFIIFTCARPVSLIPVGGGATPPNL